MLGSVASEQLFPIISNAFTLSWHPLRPSLSLACPASPVKYIEDMEGTEFNRGTTQHRPVLSFIDFSKGSVKIGSVTT